MNPIVLTFGGKRLVNSSGKALFRYGTTTIEGRTYKTVRIGNQEWLAENLQLTDGGTGVMMFNNGSYSDGEIIYQHDAARRVAASVGDGWRLPTNADMEELCSKTGVTLLHDSAEEDPERTYEVLLNTTDWPGENGTDLYGFNLLPVGFNSAGSYFDDRGTTNFWSYDASDSKGYHFIINYGTPVVCHGAYLATWGNSTCYYSVRLVRDASMNL